MKKILLLLNVLLVFCSTLEAQTARNIVIIKKEMGQEIREKVRMEVENATQFTHLYNYSFSGQGNPCKPFIGVGTSREASGGLHVDYTVDNTPATQYGVLEGDVILALDGVKVATQTELERERDKHKQGEAFTLSIVRGGRPMTINARFKECSQEELAQQRKQEEGLRPILGVFEGGEAGVEGLSISEVIPGKGAAAAGLKPGDVVTVVDGKAINGASTLRGALATRKPGEAVTVVYLRDGQSRNATVTLSGDRAYFFHHTVERDPCVVFIGVYTGTGSAIDGRGVRVSGTIDGTPAKASDVRPGDVILALDDMPVNSYTELRRERDKHKPGDYFELTVLRDGAEMTIEAQFKECPKPGEETKPVEETAEMLPETAPADQPADRTLETTLQVTAFDAYPNPTAGMVNIRFEAEAGPTTVRITDASGKMVYVNELSDFNGYFAEQVDLFGKTPGTYTVSVQQGKKLVSKNVVLLPRA